MGKIIHDEIVCPQLGNRNKKIHICLPQDYEKNLQKKYPVLYMHDGQNMVDPSPLSGYSWNVEPILAKMEKAGKIEEIIVVGIDTEDAFRIQEYTQAVSKRVEKQLEKALKGHPFLPEAHLYGKSIVETIKPYIDSHYRTLADREHTGMFGSSCGGNVSLYLGVIYNDLFGVLGAFSPAYFLVKEDLFPRLQAKTFLPETKIYHDMGAKETRFSYFTDVAMAKKFNKLMIAKGFDSDHLKMVIDKDGLHTELFWQSRLPEFIQFAFPKKS
jgi:predicted alpha/beta superfamily hydrolase